MAAKTLPSSLGFQSPNHNNITSTTPKKPAFQVSLPLRSPNKRRSSINHDKPPQTTSPPMNPNPYSSATTTTPGDGDAANNYNNVKCSVSDVLRLMDALSLRTLPPDLYASLVDECTAASDLRGAEDLHRHITRNNRLKTKPLYLLNRLLLMHVSQDRPRAARQLFDAMPSKDFKSWAVLIVAYLNLGENEEALRLFLDMVGHVSMVEFPSWVLTCFLKTCENSESVKQIHSCSVKLGHSDDLPLASCLIESYEKFGCPDSADVAFKKLPRRSSRAWTARMVDRSRRRLFSDSVGDFNRIGNEGVKKNAVMFSCVLKSCSRSNDLGVSGRVVHGDAVKLGLESDPYVQCGLVDMYGRGGLVREAERAFQSFCERRNEACWNAMLGGYIRNGLFVQALKFVYEMKANGTKVQKSLLDDLWIGCGSTANFAKQM